MIKSPLENPGRWFTGLEPKSTDDRKDEDEDEDEDDDDEEEDEDEDGDVAEEKRR